MKDLYLRAEDNGNSIELELSLRLARSLERDLEMIHEDNTQALQAFNRKEGFNFGDISKKRKGRNKKL